MRPVKAGRGGSGSGSTGSIPSVAWPSDRLYPSSSSPLLGEPRTPDRPMYACDAMKEKEQNMQKANPRALFAEQRTSSEQSVIPASTTFRYKINDSRNTAPEHIKASSIARALPLRTRDQMPRPNRAPTKPTKTMLLLSSIRIGRNFVAITATSKKNTPNPNSVDLMLIAASILPHVRRRKWHSQRPMAHVPD